MDLVDGLVLNKGLELVAGKVIPYAATLAFSEFSEFFWGHECFTVGVRAIKDRKRALAYNHKKIRDGF